MSAAFTPRCDRIGKLGFHPLWLYYYTHIGCISYILTGILFLLLVHQQRRYHMELIAYSPIGKFIAKVLTYTVYRNERRHWVQDRIATGRWSK